MGNVKTPNLRVKSPTLQRKLNALHLNKKYALLNPSYKSRSSVFANEMLYEQIMRRLYALEQEIQFNKTKHLQHLQKLEGNLASIRRIKKNFRHVYKTKLHHRYQNTKRNYPEPFKGLTVNL